MAIIKDPKDPQGLMAALGPGALGMSSSEENLIGDEPTESTESNTVNNTGEFLQLVKDLAKKKGEDIPITFLNSLFNDLGESLGLSIKKEMMAFANVITPEIQTELMSLSNLFNSVEEKDRNDAYIRLQKFVDKLGIDLSKYSRAMGENFNQLREFYNKKQQQLKQEELLKIDRLSILYKEQERLKQENVITRVNESNNRLEILTKKQQIIEEKILRQDEKKFIERKEKILREERDLLKKGTLDESEQRQIRVGRRFIKSGESSLTSRSESLGVDRQESSTIGRLARGTGAVLRGESGPSAIRNIMGTIYQTLPTTQLKFALENINENLLGIPGKVLTPITNSVKKVSSILTEKMGDLFKTGFEPLKNKITKDLMPALGRMTTGFLRSAAGLLANPLVLKALGITAAVAAVGYGGYKALSNESERNKSLSPDQLRRKSEDFTNSEMGLPNTIEPINDRSNQTNAIIKSSREGTLQKITDFKDINLESSSEISKAPFIYTNAPQNVVNQTNETTSITVDINNPDKTFNIINI